MTIATAPATSLEERLQSILLAVQTPGQYVGGELNQVVKDHARTDLSFALAFPDTYEIGMSHLGLQILYHILNQRVDCVAERVFAPWPDMSALMRETGLPLFSLETRRPVREFDVFGFSLQYELSYSNVVHMLDLAGIPLLAAERTLDDPLVIVGGSCAFAPEPIADFVDFVFLGDAEDQIVVFADLLRDLKRTRLTRKERLREIAMRVPGAYAPSLYDVRYRLDGQIREVRPTDPRLPFPVRSATVADFENAPYPTRPIVPNVKTVHDRITLEIMRGCTQGCRFCQAGMIKRPLRVRSVEKLVALAEAAFESTGHDEIGLTSLSSSDYPFLQPLMKELGRRFDSRMVSLSLPSLRVNEQLRQLPSILKNIRKSGLTLAPEVATDRLRLMINKNIRNEDLYAGVRAAFTEGWNSVKIYLMVGIPGELDSDIEGIAEMARTCSDIRQEVDGRQGEINVTVSTFVPKAFTPFQWEGQATLPEIRRKQKLLQDACRRRAIRLKFHESGRSHLEGVMSRGDRRVGKVIRRAVLEHGRRFDAWDEHYDHDAWMKAFVEEGIDPAWYALRARPPSEVLPWDHLDCGVDRNYLWAERERAYAQLDTNNCQTGKCMMCGVDPGLCWHDDGPVSA